MGGRFKLWYCNVTRPATLTDSAISAQDLALDLLVIPGQETAVLDQDEFDALKLPPGDRDSALAALEELMNLAKAGKLPRTIL